MNKSDGLLDSSANFATGMLPCPTTRSESGRFTASFFGSRFFEPGAVPDELAVTGRSRRPREAERARQVERIRQQLGFQAPGRLVGTGFLDDGGSGFIELVDAQGKPLSITMDNRLQQIPHPIPRRLIVPSRFVYLHAHPTSPEAVRLEHGSRAESAVVDLIRLQVRSMVSAREESSLVRGQRRARSRPNNPAYALSVWRNTLSPVEKDALALRDIASGIEARRRLAASDRGSLQEEARPRAGARSPARGAAGSPP